MNEMVLNGLPPFQYYDRLQSFTPGPRCLSNPVWGPFLCYHDKITILDIMLANLWWSQQPLDIEFYSDYGQTNEILSNMETKLLLVLHVDHKPLNIKTTLLNRLRNVNTIVIFIQLHRSSTVHLRLFTVQPLPSQDGGELARHSNRNHIYMSMTAMPFSMFVYPPILFFSGSAAVSSRLLQNKSL